jgi:N-hydroxyarylamine O-acetyltransferase
VSPAKADVLPAELLERVLDGLGLAGIPAADLAGLRAVYGAWCRRVPFDNIRKLIHVRSEASGALPGDSAEDFFSAWLKYRTGGTCWAGNGALCTLLATLGFAARRGVATMMVAPDIPPNHGTVIVEIEGAPYVVDASILHVEPLRLTSGQVTTIEHSAWGVRAAEHGTLWHIEWRPIHTPGRIECRIDQLAATRAEFHERYAKTRAWSPFNYELHARRVVGDSMVGVAHGQRIEFNASGAHLQRRLHAEERNRVLIDELGLNEEIVAQLPPDIPTPPPPWSRTAQAALSR